MGKTVNESHITGRKGVNKFEKYCLNHDPPILWKPENVNDFGIDGEVELTAINKEGKTEATGQVIKIQIKSTLHGSYKYGETESGFKFLAKDHDYKYWTDHNLDVILVIYDAQVDSLYAKKISELEQEKTSKSIPIKFSKQEDLLKVDESNFTSKFADKMLPRVEFGKENRLLSNLFPFTKLPKFVYRYKSKYKKFNKILELTKGHGFPIISLRSDEIVSLIKAENYSYFYDNIIDGKIERNGFKQYIQEIDNRYRIYEILNKLFEVYCSDLSISYNKKFKRYYFNINQDEKVRKEKYNPRLSPRNELSRSVVKFHEYFGTEFYLHSGFETHFMYSEGELNLILSPKLLYTYNGKKPLEDKELVTKLAGYIKSNTWNDKFVNDIYFLFQYLSKGGGRIKLAVQDDYRIEIGNYLKFDVNFGIRNMNSSQLTDGNSKQESDLFT